jgi:hypothetical protein
MLSIFGQTLFYVFIIAGGFILREYLGGALINYENERIRHSSEFIESYYYDLPRNIKLVRFNGKAVELLAMEELIKLKDVPGNENVSDSVNELKTWLDKVGEGITEEAPA